MSTQRENVPFWRWGSMNVGGLWVSGKERARSRVVRQSVEGLLGQFEVSERLGIGVRQFKRLVRRWREVGDAGLVSLRRGRPAPNRLDDATRDRVKVLLTDKDPDFGATLASEKVLELDGVAVSRESVRRLQIEMNLWKPKRWRARRVFQLRERRPRFGELIQFDGSPYAWFKGRGPDAR
jgi:transposase